MRKERSTQDRVVALFQQQLGYTYLGNWEERAGNSNGEERLLKEYLRGTKKYSDALINKALFEFRKTATLNVSDDLYPINRAVYSALRYGVKVREEVGENVQTVWLIDWENPLSNHFALAEEVTIKGEKGKRPDVVLCVNGIALAVLELKRASVS